MVQMSREKLIVSLFSISLVDSPVPVSHTLLRKKGPFTIVRCSRSFLVILYMSCMILGYRRVRCYTPDSIDRT